MALVLRKKHYYSQVQSTLTIMHLWFILCATFGVNNKLVHMLNQNIEFLINRSTDHMIIILAISYFSAHLYSYCFLLFLKKIEGQIFDLRDSALPVHGEM